MTRNPETLPNGAFQPLLDKARELASPAGIRIVGPGPMGSRGFRSGHWTVERDAGRPFQVYASVPHECDLAEQHARVRQAAALAFAIMDLRAAGYPEERPPAYLESYL